MWSTAPQPKDDDDDDDACACLRTVHVYFDILSPVFLEFGRLMLCLSHDDSTALLLVSNPSRQEVYFSILCSPRLPIGLLAYTDIAESVKA